jgi:hypothetical protein
VEGDSVIGAAFRHAPESIPGHERRAASALQIERARIGLVQQPRMAGCCWRLLGFIASFAVGPVYACGWRCPN